MGEAVGLGVLKLELVTCNARVANYEFIHSFGIRSYQAFEVKTLSRYCKNVLFF